MATVILHTSCAFPHGNGADPLGDGGPAAARFGAGAGVDGINRGIPPLASATSTPAPFGATGSHKLHGANAHHTPRGRAGPSDHDALAAHAIHCDVSLVPRIPLNVNDSESPSSNAVQRIQSLHLAEQPLLPCGRSNFISVEDLPLAAGDDGGAYLLGLANCHIRADGGGGASPLALPVAAAPSTFALSFREEGGGASFGGDAIHVVGGGVHRVGEVAVAFDLGGAVELYRERIVNLQKGAECPLANRDADVLQARGGSNATAPQPEQRRSEVASILQSLEEESAFIRKTLAALGCAGVMIVGALGWTLWRMSRSKRPRRRRARAANDARRPGVPHEIGARVANGSEEAAPGDEGRRRRRVPVTPDVSPLQPPAVVDPRGRDVRLQFPAISPVRRSSDDGERAGDLRLVSTRTPPSSPLSANEDLGATEEGKQQSPRHWYESLLSPQANDVKEDGEASCLAVTTFSFAKEDVARALYSPLKSTAKKASDEQGRQLDFDTPMARLSKLAPTPSKVSPATLSRRIESSVGSLDRASREGEDAVEPPAQTSQAAFEEELRSVASDFSSNKSEQVAEADRDSAFENDQRSVEMGSMISQEDATIDRGLLSTTTELNDLLDDADDAGDSVDNPVDATLVTVDTSTSVLEAVAVKAVGEGNVSRSFLSMASDGTAEVSIEMGEAPRELQVVSPDATSVADGDAGPFSFASPSLLPGQVAAADDVPVANDELEFAEEPSVVEEEVASVHSLSTVDFDESSSASSEILLTPDNFSRESAGILDEEVNEARVDDAMESEDEDGIASPPKVKVERYPMGFLEELTEKTSGRATSPNTSGSNVSSIKTPSPQQDFESSIAECAALLKTPKRLTPIASTPDSSNEDSSSNEFLSDYW